MHHPQGTGTTAHHVPVLTAQPPGVDLFQQTFQGDRSLPGTDLHGVGAETALQQFQNLGLFVEGFTGPEPCPQGIGFGLVQLLLLRGGEVRQVRGFPQHRSAG